MSQGPRSHDIQFCFLRLFLSRVLQNSGLCPPVSRSLTVLTTVHLIQLFSQLSSRVLQDSSLCPPAPRLVAVLTTAFIISSPYFSHHASCRNPVCALLPLAHSQSPRLFTSQLSTSLSSLVLQKSGLCPPASPSLTILTSARIFQCSCFVRVFVLRRHHLVTHLSLQASGLHRHLRLQRHPHLVTHLSM